MTGGSSAHPVLVPVGLPYQKERMVTHGFLKTLGGLDSKSSGFADLVGCIDEHLCLQKKQKFEAKSIKIIHPSYIYRFCCDKYMTQPFFPFRKRHDKLWGPNILWYDVEEDGRVFKLVSFRFSPWLWLKQECPRIHWCWTSPMMATWPQDLYTIFRFTPASSSW